MSVLDNPKHSYSWWVHAKSILILSLIGWLSGCTKSSDEPTDDNTRDEQVYNKVVDERPGIKGIYLGMTLHEVSDRVKKTYPGTSHLNMINSVVLDYNKTMTFSLADSLHILGEYHIKKLYGQAYNDTIINLRAKFDSEKAIKAMPEVLTDIYGFSDVDFLKYDIFRYEGNKYKVEYNYQLGIIEFIDKDFQRRINIEREDTMKVKPVDKAVQDF